jgi:hypothetical protein
MLTFDLSLPSAGEARVVGAAADGAFSTSAGRGSVFGGFSACAFPGSDADEPDSFALAASRGAGGGRGGLDADLVAGVLRSVEVAFALAFVPTGASPWPYGLRAAGIWRFAGPP